MASRRQLIRQAWDDAQARDLRDLPDVARKVRPGAFGTFPEDQPARLRAPTLDVGPIDVGEWREEVNGQELTVPGSTSGAPSIVGGTPQVVLATLRRPWPWVAFAIDVSKFPVGTSILAGLNVLTRSGHAVLVANMSGNVLTTPTIAWTVPAGPSVKNTWIAMTGVSAGARVELWIQHSNEGAVKTKGDLWGYNEPGYGP